MLFPGSLHMRRGRGARTPWSQSRHHNGSTKRNDAQANRASEAIPFLSRAAANRAAPNASLMHGDGSAHWSIRKIWRRPLSMACRAALAVHADDAAFRPLDVDRFPALDRAWRAAVRPRHLR